jgi:glycosyltransferase involved in cell wall biosynthesis
MMAGFARARELGYEAVVMLDGDGQHNPDEIPAVAAPVLAGVADLVIGSRFLDVKANIPAYRRRRPEGPQRVHEPLDRRRVCDDRLPVGLPGALPPSP